MLYDTLENLNQYTGLFENLDTAIAFIESHDLGALADGRTEIDGERVFVTVAETAPQPREALHFETHTNYMDLHVDLAGTELCEVALGDVRAAGPYSEETDSALWDGEMSAALVLGPGRFAVFMAEEPHRPGIRARGSDRVKKAVFKIAY